MAPADEVLYAGRRISVVRRWQTVGSAEPAPREVVLHPGAVVVLPWIDDEHLCLIRNVRVAVGETLWELPAGTCEPPEPPLETARRELIEETGYTCQEIRLMTTFYASPGILSEKMHLYEATGLTPGDQQLEAGEEIVTEAVRFADAVRMAVSGEIRDAKTLVGILLAAQRRL